MSDMDWPETTGTVARKAGCSTDVVRQYADDGLIESRRLPNKVRLFRANAPALVRKLKAERLAKRGKYRRGARAEASV